MVLPVTTLQSLRTLARRFSDMLFSDFVTDDELNVYINLGLRELYDTFAEHHGQEYFIKAVNIELEPPKTMYELPDDLVSVKNVSWAQSALPTTEIFSEPVPGYTFTYTYDVPIDEVTDAVTLEPYPFEDLNGDGVNRSPGYRSGYVDKPKYRVLASRKHSVIVQPIGDGGAPVTVFDEEAHVNLIRLNRETTGHLHVWYWPEVPQLTEDSSSFPMFHGFEEFPALVAAIMMLAKEESDTATLVSRLGRLKKRIEVMANNRDIGMPEPIYDVGY